MARRTLILVAAGLLAAAGCLPAPPPPARATEACGLSFTSAGDYQSAFYTLAQADTGWITADGFVPVSLADGRTAWWMSDTMTGTTNPDNSVPNPENVHNSVVKQGQGCLTPQLGGQDPSWTDFIPPAANGDWYWPGSAVVEGDTMAVFAWRVRADPSGDPGFEWQVVGTAVARFGLPSLQLLEPPADMPVNRSLLGGDFIPWGIRSFNAGGTVYLYGTTKQSGIGPSAAWVARAPFAQVADQSAWQFSTGLPAPLDWSNQLLLARPMTFTSNDPPLAQLSVAPYGNRYIASAFRADVFKDNDGRAPIRAWIADSPRGPWQTLGDVATFQHRNPDQFAYDARLVDLPGAGWTVVYSVNDLVNQWDDFTLYRGEFEAPAGLPAP